jgi:hypothetical protein
MWFVPLKQLAPPDAVNAIAGGNYAPCVDHERKLYIEELTKAKGPGFSFKDICHYMFTVFGKVDQTASSLATALMDEANEMASEFGAVPHEAVKVTGLTADQTSMVRYIVGISIGAAALTGIALVLYKIFGTTQKDTEAQYASRMRTMETKSAKERLAAVSQKFTAKQGFDEDCVLKQKIRSHIVLLTEDCDDDDFQPYTHGLLIDGQNLILNRHTCLRDFELVEKRFNMTVVSTTGILTYPIILTPSKLIDLYPERAGNDIVCHRLPTAIPGIKDITGLFIEERYINTSEFATTDVEIHTLEGSRLGKTINLTDMAVLVHADQMKTKSALNVYKSLTYACSGGFGDCGAPVIGRIRGSIRIVGIHVGFDGRFSDAGTISREAIMKIKKPDFYQMDFKESVMQGFVPSENINVDVAGLAPRGNFLPVATTIKPVKGSSKTSQKKTPFHERRDHKLTQQTTCRVRPARSDHRLLPIIEEKYGKIRKPFAQDLLDFATACYKQMHVFPKKPLREFTLLEAVNLIPADASVGYGWSCRRKDLLIWDVRENLYNPAPSLCVAVNRLSESCSQGIFPMCLLTSFLKDETLPNAKYDYPRPDGSHWYPGETIAGKTRSFQISPIEYLVYGMMTIGDWMYYKHSNPIDFPSTVGMDPASIEWNRIFSPMVARLMSGWKMVDLDFEAMEATVTAQMFKWLFDLTTLYYQDEGTPSYYRRLGYFMMMCQSCKVVSFNIFMELCGNPSGKMGTTTDNSDVVFGFTAMAFKAIFPESQPIDFMNNVVTKHNGDDTVMIVSPRISENFNFLTIRSFLAEHGIVITPAKKDGDPQPFVEQLEVHFCKKNILWSEELRALVPFVSFETLLDQVSYTKDPSPEGLVMIVNSALQWSFFRGNTRKNGQIPESEPTFNEQRDYFLSKLDPSLHSKVFHYDTFMYRFRRPRNVHNAFTSVDLKFTTMQMFSPNMHRDSSASASVKTCSPIDGDASVCFFVVDETDPSVFPTTGDKQVAKQAEKDYLMADNMTRQTPDDIMSRLALAQSSEEAKRYPKPIGCSFLQESPESETQTKPTCLLRLFLNAPEALPLCTSEHFFLTLFQSMPEVSNQLHPNLRPAASLLKGLSSSMATHCENAMFLLDFFSVELGSNVSFDCRQHMDQFLEAISNDFAIIPTSQAGYDMLFCQFEPELVQILKPLMACLALGTVERLRKQLSSLLSSRVLQVCTLIHDHLHQYFRQCRQSPNLQFNSISEDSRAPLMARAYLRKLQEQSKPLRCSLEIMQCLLFLSDTVNSSNHLLTQKGLSNTSRIILTERLPTEQISSSTLLTRRVLTSGLIIRMPFV